MFFVIVCIKLGGRGGGIEEYRDAVKKSLLAKKATVLIVANGWGCSGWQLASCIIYTQIILKYKTTMSVIEKPKSFQMNCFTVSLQREVAIWFTIMCHSMIPKLVFPILKALQHKNLCWSACHFSRTDSCLIIQE